MTNMAAMPIYGKNLKTLLRNLKVDDLESWYAALERLITLKVGMQHWVLK